MNLILIENSNARYNLGLKNITKINVIPLKYLNFLFIRVSV